MRENTDFEGIAYLRGMFVGFMLGCCIIAIVISIIL